MGFDCGVDKETLRAGVTNLADCEDTDWAGPGVAHAATEAGAAGAGRTMLSRYCWLDNSDNESKVKPREAGMETGVVGGGPAAAKSSSADIDSKRDSAACAAADTQ